mmetsp:Transcript_76773/g.222892  ORF Transcript_76773/g.222892 Transcript_76773/m.222892 type:complete len:398 (+) Transcript_76773:239-1432(+)
MKALKVMTATFKPPKFKSMLLPDGVFPMAQPTSTAKGVTKRAIWTDDPTAMPTDKLILSKAANLMAATCSQALPTMGSKMMPTKSLPMLALRRAPSRESVRNSEPMETTAVHAKRRPRDQPKLKPSCSSSSSSGSSSSAIALRCVNNWNVMYATYEEMIKTAHARETFNVTFVTFVLACFAMTLSEPAIESKIVTRHKQRQETKSIEVLTMAPRVPNLCCFPIWAPTSKFAAPPFFVLLVIPPAKNDMPRTSNMFDKMEPSNVDFITVNSPFLSKAIVMIISTALPKVAFNMPLSISFFKQAANSSVASPRIFASGIRAKKLNQKVQLSDHPRIPEAKPKGTHTSRVQILLKKIDFNALATEPPLPTLLTDGLELIVGNNGSVAACAVIDGARDCSN